MSKATGYDRPTSTIKYTPFDFDGLVTSPVNEKIIANVVKLVCKEQRVRTSQFQRTANQFLAQDANLSSLTYKYEEVNWTKRDLEELAKIQYRTWRATYQAGIDEQKGAAAELRKAEEVVAGVKLPLYLNQ